MLDILYREAQQFNLTLSVAQLTCFEQYSCELVAWNQRFNLTRIVAPEEIMRRHFLDSLSIYPLLLPAGTPWALIDVGSGAGFPGLPLKIVRPELQVTLLEATRKKGDFLRHVVERLGLAGVTVLTARAEEVAHHSAHREQYDLVVARAVAPLPTLAEYTLPLAKVGGRVIAQKGRHPAPEAAEASRAIEQCGGGGTKILPVQLPDLDAPRHLVMIEKRQATPAQYPRRAGTPARHPL